MYRYMFYYCYVTVLHLSGYSVNGHFSIWVRVRVWYYFIFRDRYMIEMPEERLVKTVYMEEMPGKRPRGRPRKRWEDDL